MKRILIGIVAASAIGAAALASPSTADALSGGGWGYGGFGYRGWGYGRAAYPGWGLLGSGYGGWAYRGWGYGGWGTWPYFALGGWPLYGGLEAVPFYARPSGLPTPVLFLRASPRALNCHRSQETRTVPSEAGGTRQIVIRRCQP